MLRMIQKKKNTENERIKEWDCRIRKDDAEEDKSKTNAVPTQKTERLDFDKGREL